MSSCTSQAKSSAPDFAPRPRMTIHRFAAMLLITLAFALAFVFGISHFVSSNQWLSQQGLGTTWRNACHGRMNKPPMMAANAPDRAVPHNRAPHDGLDLTRYCLLG